MFSESFKYIFNHSIHFSEKSRTMFLRAFLPLIPKYYIVIEQKLDIIVRE